MPDLGATIKAGQRDANLHLLHVVSHGASHRATEEQLNEMLAKLDMLVTLRTAGRLDPDTFNHYAAVMVDDVLYMASVPEPVPHHDHCSAGSLICHCCYIGAAEAGVFKHHAGDMVVMFRLSVDEFESVKTVAQSRGRTLGTWLRDIAILIGNGSLRERR